VAALALLSLVLVGKRKAGIAIVIESGRFPALLAMAGFALVSQPALVYVIGLVTGDALGRQFFAVQRRAVTGIALCGGVFAQQWIAGLARVVELGLPVGRRVAGLALVAVATLVRILLAMTGDAGTRRVLETIVGVAGLAFCFVVLAGEREPGLCVIEASVFPGRVVVTFVAFLTQFTLVLVVLAMTGNAR